MNVDTALDICSCKHTATLNLIEKSSVPLKVVLHLLL